MPRRHPSKPPLQLLGAMDVFVQKLIEAAGAGAPIADRVAVGRLATSWCAVRFGNKIEADDEGMIDDLRADLDESKSARNQREARNRALNRAIERAASADTLDKFRREFVPPSDAGDDEGGIDGVDGEDEPDAGSDRRLRARLPHDDAG